MSRMIHHPGSVVILPQLADGRVVFVWQYRRAVRRYLLELPAGTLESGEKRLAAARRELAEETGYRAQRWRKIVACYPSPGMLDEQMTLYLARDLSPVTVTPPADEAITVRRLTLQRAQRLIRQGRIQDAKTLIGVMWLIAHQRNV